MERRCQRIPVMSRSPTTASSHDHNTPKTGNSQELFEKKITLNRSELSAWIARQHDSLKVYTQHYTDSNTKEEYIDWKKTIAGTKCRYSCGLPEALLNVRPPRKKREDPIKVFQDDNPGLLTKIRQRTQTDKELREYYKLHCAKTPLIGLDNGDDGISIYRLPARGSKYYGGKVECKIRLYEERIKKMDDEMFFITLTLNRNRIRNDNLTSWKLMKKCLPKFLREFNRAYGGAYICVKEAQEDGTCHAHILYANKNIPKMKFWWNKCWRTNNNEFRDGIE